MLDTSSNRQARPLLGRVGLYLKSLRLIGLLLLGIVLLPMVPLIGKRSWHLVRWWHGRMLRVLNVRLDIDGVVPSRPTLIVANHCSWLDIVVLGHAFNASFVSKAEISGWPLVGSFARAAGTLFLARGAGRTSETSARIRSVLESGRSVLFFPEGTTTTDPQPRRFHARLFAAAIDGGYPVTPVALRYCDETTPADMHHALAPWVNEAALWPHFRDLFRLREIRAEVRLCAPVDPRGYDRRSLAEACQLAVSHRQAMAAARARSERCDPVRSAA
ncbi:lysophospholipid acyltransferase family protein [Salinisphaera orenii]|uniref:Lyso-ornithine lipid acyltransferase n=1 Tax=Salinisphaera orenii YIM 95161 TaxID=1051139 RepID=A0A423Q905_9GAMM|nr:lysophospholipid acyltransferase family protein [Salinisphaera halophila]ROO36768.1 lyso-ornithine lipid acyltransferase [Salinisphaera halophila YIM 95161]